MSMPPRSRVTSGQDWVVGLARLQARHVQNREVALRRLPTAYHTDEGRKGLSLRGPSWRRFPRGYSVLEFLFCFFPQGAKLFVMGGRAHVSASHQHSTLCGAQLLHRFVKLLHIFPYLCQTMLRWWWTNILKLDDDSNFVCWEYQFSNSQLIQKVCWLTQ